MSETAKAEPDRPEEDVETAAAETGGAEAGEGATTLTAPEHDPRDLPEEEIDLSDPDEESALAPADDVLRPEDAPGDSPEDAPEAMTATEPELGPVAPPPAETARRGAFVPALLGGVIAAGIGFGAAMIAFPPGNLEAVTAMAQKTQADLAALQDATTQSAKSSDITALQSRLTALEGQLSGLGDDLTAATGELSGLTQRVTELEARPLTDSATDEAVAAYEAELERLRQSMQDQKDEISQMVSDSQDLKAEAAATARDTQIRAALVKLNASLEDGTDYEAPLKTLSELGLEIPAELDARASTGIPTMARLRTDYPDAARAALAATRDGSLGGSFGDFLKNQLGARSLTPKAGDDPDAILSRAEGKLNDGDLQGALVELDGLPEPALEAMNGWLEPARTRAHVLDAAATLQAGATQPATEATK